MSETAAKPKKDSWPRTKHGTIDWEVVFERPETGLIALVELTNSSAGVLKICRVIVHSLFSRGSDAEIRARYEREINEIMVNADDPNRSFSLEPRKVLIVELLREIKDNRVLNASFHVTRMQQGAKAATDDDDRRTEEETAPLRPESYAAEGRDDPEFPEDAFGMALTEMLAHRMEALSKDVKQTALNDHPLPFPVSHDFTDRMIALVRDHMALEMQSACRLFIRKAENEPKDQQVDYIIENMETRQNRQVIWTSWQAVWTDLTQQREPPEKPEEEEKKGLLGKFKRQKEQPDWMGETLTMEEWEDAVEMTEQANQLAKRLWAELTAPAETFQPPTDDDNTMLMNLFARTPAAITKQVTAVRQIAEQSGNQAKIFADYQQGKDIDVPLVAAICQRPDLFLEKGVLKDLMRSFPDSMRRERFRLVTRYFDDAL